MRNEPRTKSCRSMIDVIRQFDKHALFIRLFFGGLRAMGILHQINRSLSATIQAVTLSGWGEIGENMHGGIRATRGMRILSLLLIGGISLALSGQSAGPKKQSSKPPFTLFISSRHLFAANTPVEIKVRVTNTSSQDISASTGSIKGFAYGYDYDVRDENGVPLTQKQIDATQQSSDPTPENWTI